MVCLRSWSRLVTFDFTFHAREQIDRTIRITSDPSVMQFFDRERVDVVPAKTPLTLHDDKIGFFENAQVLHNSASVQLTEALD